MAINNTLVANLTASTTLYSEFDYSIEQSLNTSATMETNFDYTLEQVKNMSSTVIGQEEATYSFWFT